MLYQSYLSRGSSLLRLGLLALTSCITVAPSQAQTVDLPLVQKRGSSGFSNGDNGWVVGLGWENSEFTPLSVDSESSLGLKSTTHSSSPLKWTETPVETEEMSRETLLVPVKIISHGRSLATNTKILSSPLAQIPTISPSQDIPPLTPDLPPKRPLEPLPEPQIPVVPLLPQEVLPSPPPPPTTAEPKPGEVPETITVKQFEFEGNTAFSDEELAEATKGFTNRSLGFAEIYEVRSAITKFYRERGYITSGAIIPPQTFRNTEGVVKIQVIEGRLESIDVRGTRRLNPNYIRSRIALKAGKPLNRNALIEALQLLQLDPLIKNLSAELTAGTQPGSSLLIVEVEEAKTLHLDLSLNNNRSPNIGTFERRLELTQANLFGQGDGLNFGYSNTEGSNTFDASYTYPINPRNGTLSFATSFTFSQVVEPPFDRIDLDADSRFFALTLRQPLRRNLTEEFALGLSITNQRSEVTVFEVPVRLSPGAEEDGSTTVTALRFFQDWIVRRNRQVFALRSQFSLGLGILGATVNEDAPDSTFLAWRTQVQWLRLLAPDTLLIVGGDLQLSTNPLLRLEQFGLGGRDTVRGYRQNVLLTDNGASASAELRLPILRLPRQNALLQLAPFLDLGFAWNSSGNPDPDPEPNFLASAGLGLRFQMGDRLSARLDYGIPLVEVISTERTLQEKGLHFSLIYRIF
ncbi:ShlB/FhaC/HecB family hemolysin secretion/activation protein [Coleofasciculus sp. H7-2]|uniref:ShlB/FhaC/HecB family hemolysin secretion/activation protein n=1 Tax=Coleofasciculus sp. H7-2 TaxID=3351545 RepID=UPI00366B5FD2